MSRFEHQNPNPSKFSNLENYDNDYNPKTTWISQDPDIQKIYSKYMNKSLTNTLDNNNEDTKDKEFSVLDKTKQSDTDIHNDNNNYVFLNSNISKFNNNVDSQTHVYPQYK